MFGAACSGNPPGPGPDGNPPPTPPEPSPPASALTPPPVSGGTLLIARDGRTAIASDPDRDRVYLVDLVSKTLRATVTLPSRSEPGRAVEDAEGRVHVALRSGGTVATLDVRDGRMLANRPLCPAPRGLAFDAAANLLHVACAGGELVSIEPLAETPARTVKLDRDLRDVAVRGDRLLVTTFRSAQLLVVGPSGVDRLSPPRTRAAFSSFGRGFPTPPPPTDGTGTVQGGMAAPGVAYRMVPAPGGAAMMLHQRGVEDEVGTQPNAYGGRSCTGVVEAALTSFQPTTEGTHVIRSGGALANAVLAVDLAVSPDGRQVVVVAAGRGGTDQQVTFYASEEATRPTDPEMPPCIPGSPNPMPGMGMGGMPDPQGGMPDPIEYRPPNGEVVAVAFDPRGNILVQSREPATLQILTQRVAPIVLSTEIRADQGHRLFHAATSGGLSCASCHPEGGEDGRTWRFSGLGARRTQSLRGGIMDTAPFHWNGDLPTFDHLMTDVFQGRMGGGSVEREEVRSLGRWLDQVPAVRLSSWHESGAVARGKALFESPTVGCVACHRGSDYTVGTSFDVGTGGSFQVPQLHNLAFRAPFMHDGCATTLLERFTKCGGGDKHGVTSTLSQPQLDDLIAYLESL
jgi:mono/diheme cytochrome c family protein